MAASAGGASQVLRRYRRIGVNVRLDGVNSVTVGAHRRLGNAAAHRLAVNALHELLFHSGMALAAGFGNIEFEDGRFVVAGGANLVNAVAVRAHRCLGALP